MVEIKATHKYPIPLGRTGENEAARIAFTLAPFEEVFPGGTPALLVKRKGDSAAYPVTLTVDGLTAYWTVTSADTDKAGFGQCELQWYLGNTLAKSNKFDFIVIPALEAGAEPPDAPSKRWFDAIQAQIGDLSKLTTKAKDNLVAAINEAARSGGGGSGTVTEADIEKALGYKPIGADDVPVKSVNGATGATKSAFYVTITSAEDESISADKTLEEIYTAYEKGYAVYAKTATSPQIIVPLTIAVHSGNDYAVVFNGAVTFGDTTEYAISNDGSGWTIYAKDIAFKDNIPTIPTALKNPHPLNIKIGNATTIYDGSAEQTVEIPDGGTGKDGKDGITPTIGTNGNWYLGDEDTGKPSRGATGAPGADGTPGKDGAPGAAGKDGHTPVITASKSGKVTTIKADGEAIATVNDGADGTNGADGTPGKDGVTPDIQIGTVTTLPAGSEATASMGGTAANPTLNLGIPKGADGDGANVTKDAVVGALGFTPISADDVPVKKVNGQTGEVKSTFYVTVTQGNGYIATADKTAAEVYAAYEAGYAVYAIAKFRNISIPYTLPLEAAVNISGNVVFGFGAAGSTDPTQKPNYLCVAYNGEDWLAWNGTLAKASDIPTIPTALKNPNALNIKIGDTTTSYDGSAAKTVEIPEGGGTDESLGITGAAAGKIPKIKEVDAAGKPTAWEATALPNEAFIVYFTREIQLEGDPILTSDRTPEEVIAAIASKKLVIALLKQNNEVTQLCNISNTVSNLYFFTILKDGGAVGIGWNIEADDLGEKTYTLTTMAPLSFITYSGTSAPNQIFGTGDIGGYEFKQHIGFENLPGVTTSDNGKFMRVVNGAWKAVELLNAGGVSF